MTAATPPDCIDDEAARAACCALASRLLDVMLPQCTRIETALDALLHAYVAIVRAHPQLVDPAGRSLLSAVRVLDADASHKLH